MRNYIFCGTQLKAILDVLTTSSAVDHSDS